MSVPRRVLLVDDDVAEISAAKRGLARCDCQPLLATSAAEGLAAVTQRVPSVVVIAADCDGGKALALVRRLVEEEDPFPVPVILLGEAAGAPLNVPRVPRPLDPAELADEVESTLREASRRTATSPAPSPPPPDESTSAEACAAAAQALLARANELRQAHENRLVSNATRHPTSTPTSTATPRATSTPTAPRHSSPAQPIRPPAAAPPIPLAAGSLADVPAPRLLALAARAGLTGRLDFATEPPRSLYFEDGAIVGATSAAPHERVEDVALRLGLVTRDQHRALGTATATASVRRAALLLLDRGYLKPAELTEIVRRRTEEVVFALFDDVPARYRWTPAAVPADERIALERATLALAVEGVRRRWLAPRLDAVLGANATLLAPADDAPPLDELGLDSTERRLAEMADGFRAIDEIVASSALDPLSSRQCLAALAMVGALELRTRAEVDAPGTSRAIDLARVREKLDQVRHADYFAILGLPRACTPHEVKERVERISAEFHPDRFADCSDEGLPEQLDEILHVVEDAREVLGDDQLRAEYLRALG